LWDFYAFRANTFAENNARKEIISKKYFLCKRIHNEISQNISLGVACGLDILSR